MWLLHWKWKKIRISCVGLSFSLQINLLPRPSPYTSGDLKSKYRNISPVVKSARRKLNVNTLSSGVSG